LEVVTVITIIGSTIALSGTVLKVGSNWGGRDKKIDAVAADAKSSLNEAKLQLKNQLDDVEASLGKRVDQVQQALEKKVDGASSTLDGLEKNGCGLMRAVDTRATRLETQFQPFTKLIEGMMAQLLHHDNTPGFDELTRRFDKPMTLDDLERYHAFLGIELNNALTNGGERAVALSIAMVRSQCEWRIIVEQKHIPTHNSAWDRVKELAV
jgi:hypothetical protein